MAQVHGNRKRGEFSYTIDRKFDKVGVFTTFDELPKSPMGWTEWPEQMEPCIVGTPVDVRKHMQKVRKEASARAARGENSEYYIAIWVDGIWLLEQTPLIAYYIQEASYSGKKPYVLEGTHWVDAE